MSEDRKHEMVHHFSVTDASVHDSQMLNQVPGEAHSGAGMWADTRIAELRPGNG